MWFGGEAQVQQETPRDSRQTHEETAEQQGLAAAISLAPGEADHLLSTFQVNPMAPMQSWKAKLQTWSGLSLVSPS